MEEKQEMTTHVAAERSGKQTPKQLFWEIFRFLIVGATATVADYFVFWLFDGVLFPLLFTNGIGETIGLTLATALGFCAGLFVNWLLSIRFVFRDVKDKENATSKKSFGVFTLIGVIGLAITEVGVIVLVAVLPEIVLFGTAELFGTTWSKWLAKIVMTCIVLVWNYLGRKIFIFRS